MSRRRARTSPHAEIGERLRAAREARGVSVSECAAALGVARGFVSSIELGHKPIPAGRASVVAKVYGLDPYDLAAEIAVRGGRLVLPVDPGEERAAVAHARRWFAMHGDEVDDDESAPVLRVVG